MLAFKKLSQLNLRRRILTIFDTQRMELPKFDHIYAIDEVCQFERSIIVILSFKIYANHDITQTIDINVDNFFDWVVANERNIFAIYPDQTDVEPELGELVLSYDEYFEGSHLNDDVLEYIIANDLALIKCQK